MSQYSHKEFNSKRYDSARPTYPDELYQELLKYHQGPTKLAIDVGTGSGFVSYKLSSFFDKVIGTDISETMIKSCLINDKYSGAIENGKLQFDIGTGEKQPPQIEDQSVDLITAAECCHWFNHDAFFEESSRVLRTGGTLGIWFYRDPVFIGHPEADEIYWNYSYNSLIEIDEDGKEIERWMGPFYEQPGHEFLRTFLGDVSVPKDKFKDDLTVEYNPLVDSESKSPLFIKKRITVKIFEQYVKSWSAYLTWMKTYGHKYDVAERMTQELKDKLGWDDDTEFEIVFRTWYKFLRRT
ncbi:uncharacterized protein KQ657_001757 [Scheffersomyces spartinae]|uniref:Methyltransferase type 11 domain-containing protein n=1 Tax=Scheffersomyces spartinae TaxID=45513 RepID=A0A9P8AH58_9ASCO|nr:uncharacterized protein KQ657_001757 [Scheffersomyces spartinae]KAG7192358.1 hypothetical protein KQ657_001757 [Scheffersomyces spartinae]